MFHFSSYFGRNSARHPRLNSLLMCILPPLKFALCKNSLNGSEPCWRWDLNSLSRARKREGNIKTNEDTKKTLWRLLMCPKTNEIEQSLWCAEQLLQTSCPRSFSHHCKCVCLSLCLRVRVCVHPHGCACVQILVCLCGKLPLVMPEKNINRMQAMLLIKHY